MLKLPPRRPVVHAEGHDPEAFIRATDNDASQARLSSVRKQYLRDPFISFFVPQHHLVPSRPPLINIGTYLRTKAIDELVMQWLECVSSGGQKAQIVSLGAGSDTRFWRIASERLSRGGQVEDLLMRYLELDFADNTAQKVKAIQQNKELNSIMGNFTAAASSLTSTIYTARGVDLRDFRAHFTGFISSVEGGASNPSECLLDTSLPTLVIAECVLVYMDQTYSDALIKWFADTFDIVGAVAYEMFGLNDNFGKVMRENLKARSVTLPGVDAYPTLEAQCRRFTDSGFTSALSLSLRTIRNEYIHPTELGRIAKLEFLDEIEELELVLDHYVIAWGIKLPRGTASRVEGRFARWALKRKEQATETVIYTTV